MLKIWLPFNKDERNIGLSQNCRNFTITNFSMSATESPIDNGKCGYGYGIYHMSNDDFDNNFTVATWVRKNTAWSVTNNIVSCKNIDSSGVYQWYMSVFSSTTQCGLRFNVNNGGQWGSYNFLLNTWYHIAGTYNGTTKQYSIYVNGVQITGGTATTPKTTGCTNIGISSRSTNAAGTSYTGDNLYLSDFRVYDNALEPWEIKKLAAKKSFEMEAGLSIKEITNLGGSSIKYDGKVYEQAYTASSWGGDKGTAIVHKNGGYNNLPYKEYYKTASGTGGIYFATTKDISIQSGKTYTASMWIKSDISFTDSTYSFNINGVIPNDSNHYITPSKSVTFGTEWDRKSYTFTAKSGETGNFYEMSILYYDKANNFHTYYSGFQIEEGKEASPFTFDHRDETFVDVSGRDSIFEASGITHSASTLYFNGVNSAIKIPLHKIISAGTWTINLWFYRPNGQFGTKSWETLIGGPSGFELSSSSSSTKTAFVCPYSWGGGKYPYDMDRWNMVTLSRTPSASKLYLNGDLVKTGSVGSMPAGDYFIGAWKTSTQQNFKGYMKRFSVYRSALSDEDIMNLYIHNE